MAIMLGVLSAARVVPPLVIAFFAQRIGRLESHASWAIMSAIALVAGTAFLAIASSDAVEGTALFVLGAVACGLGSETLLLMCHELYVRLGFDSVKRLMLWRIGLDAAFALLALLPGRVVLSACLVLPVVCAVSYLIARRLLIREAVPNKPSGLRSFSLKSRTTLFIGMGILILTFGFGFMQSAFGDRMFGDWAIDAGFWVTVTGRVLTFFLMLALMPLLHDFHFERLFQAAVMASIAAFLALLLPFQQNFAAFHLLTIVAAFVTEYATFLLSIYAASRASGNSLGILSWGQAAMRAGGIPSCLVGLMVSSSLAANPENQLLPYVLCGCVLVLALAGIWLLSERAVSGFLWGKEEGSRREHAGADAGRVMERIANQAGLTQREAEVFGLLMEGRSVPYIKETLYISISTAKTHVRHIYQKFGVHDRQELISLVQERIAKGSERD